MTAVGLNESGAIFAGLRTRWLKVLAFALSGLLAGVAGIMIIAQAGAASSFGLGSDLLLPGIAAAIVGGTAITGGVTNPLNVDVRSAHHHAHPDRRRDPRGATPGAEPRLWVSHHHRRGADP